GPSVDIRTKVVKGIAHAKMEKFLEKFRRRNVGTSQRLDGIEDITSEMVDLRKRIDKLLGSDANIAPAKSRARATKIFKELDIKAIRIKDDAGTFGRTVDTVLIMDPDLIKKTEMLTAFDREKALGAIQ
ncbi:hypothetical protein LCGC14_3080600, partial [marine sediment metagenome]